MANPRQDPVVNTIRKDGKPVTRDQVPWTLRPFPTPERLLHTFRINARIPSSAQPLGGWEAPDCELRGHYVGGHYLSAAALMYASTGDEDLKNQANTVVVELAKCQTALKSGYLSAFPVESFDRLRNREKVWAPFYTIHKIMAGNLDMYVPCGDEQALDVARKIAEWVAGYTGRLSSDHLQRVLGTEFGGMGEVLSNLYAVTGGNIISKLRDGSTRNCFLIHSPIAATN